MELFNGTMNLELGDLLMRYFMRDYSVVNEIKNSKGIFLSKEEEWGLCLWLAAGHNRKQEV